MYACMTLCCFALLPCGCGEWLPSERILSEACTLGGSLWAQRHVVSEGRHTVFSFFLQHDQVFFSLHVLVPRNILIWRTLQVFLLWTCSDSVAVGSRTGADCYFSSSCCAGASLTLVFLG